MVTHDMAGQPTQSVCTMDWTGLCRLGKGSNGGLAATNHYSGLGGDETLAPVDTILVQMTPSAARPITRTARRRDIMLASPAIVPDASPIFQPSDTSAPVLRPLAASTQLLLLLETAPGPQPRRLPPPTYRALQVTPSLTPFDNNTRHRQPHLVPPAHSIYKR